MTYEDILPGGKGINVSIVLSNLGTVLCPRLRPRASPARVVRLMQTSGAKSDFIQVAEGRSRINMKIEPRRRPRSTASAPDRRSDIEALYAKLDALQPGDTLVIAGSVPSMLPSDMYSERIMDRLDGRGVNIVVDAERDPRPGPGLPPLPHQAQQPRAGRHLWRGGSPRYDQVVPYARKLQEKGARNVLISMAGEGAVLVPGSR